MAGWSEHSMTAVVGAVLVGGQSRRMGEPKALIDVGGQALAARVAAALVGGGAGRVVLIGGDRALAQSLDLSAVVDDWEVLPDRWTDMGPLGGMTTALLDAAPGSDAVVVVAACDQPDLTAGLVARLIDALGQAETGVIGARVATADGRRHPFPSAWRSSAGPMLELAIERGQRRADAAFGVGRIVEVHADGASLIDLDTPEDVRGWRQVNRWANEPPEHRP